MIINKSDNNDLDLKEDKGEEEYVFKIHFNRILRMLFTFRKEVMR